MGLFVAVSAFMFFIGLLVGRGNAPVHFDINTLQKDLAALRHHSEEATAPLSARVEPAVADKSDLEFYETLTADDGDGEELRQARPGDRNPEQVPRKKRALKAATKKTMVAQQTIRRSQPSGPSPVKLPDQATAATLPQKTSTPTPTGIPSGDTAASDRYAIQVAAFKDSSDAQRLLTELLKKGYSAYRVSAETPDGVQWHRVRIGPFREKTEAEALLSGLRKEKLQGFVLRQ